MKSAQWFLAAFILSCSLFVTGHAVASAAEPAPSAAKAPSTSPEAKQEGEKTEFYVGVYLQGSRPLNRPVRLQEDPFTNTDVQGGLGGGLKVGVFPAFAGRFVGLEADLSGLDGKVNALRPRQAV
jgi:ABC-type amino acid transport substrate-binding protein